MNHLLNILPTGGQRCTHTLAELIRYGKARNNGSTGLGMYKLPSEIQIWQLMCMSIPPPQTNT